MRERALRRGRTSPLSPWGMLAIFPHQEWVERNGSGLKRTPRGFPATLQVGVVKTIIMGLDKIKLTPCGFCFVEYRNRRDAERAVKYLNGTKLDDREIRIDFDWGFVEGRQYGRGKTGGQVRVPSPPVHPSHNSLETPDLHTWRLFGTASHR